jgi:hypothetical protein
MQAALADRKIRIWPASCVEFSRSKAWRGYLVTPRYPVDFEVLIDAVQSYTSPNNLDVVIDVRGPIASPETCNGPMVPIVRFDQLYSFDRDELISAIPRPDDPSKDDDGLFRAAAQLFDRVIQLLITRGQQMSTAHSTI